MQDTTWTNKIATWNYTMINTKEFESNGVDYFENTGQVIYLHELNRSSKSNQTCYYNPSTTANCSIGEWKNVNAKIGLMYTSDYVLSLGSSSLSYKSSSNLSTLKTGWIHISNNDLLSSEWTMSRYGNIGGYYGALVVRSDGAVDKNGVVNSGAVRPVFYLESIVELADGVGTITEPFLIKLNGG